jgi:hypothetical protein
MTEELISTEIILCDAAQVADGKLYIIGGGWNISEVKNPAMAIAVMVTIPWSMANRRFKWSLELLDEDANPVRVGDESKPIIIEGSFEVGRPPGLKPGTTFNVPLVMNSIGTPLEEKSSYRWEFKLDGNPEASVAFYTK